MMRKIILILIVFVAHTCFAQNVFPTVGNVGIGTLNPVNNLDVNGNIQISNSSIPMGIITEVGGTTPLMNMSLNFREPNKNLNYIGAGFRIDSRDNLPLFQWLKREPNTETEQVLMSINRIGNVGIGTINPDAKLAVNGTIHSKEVKVDMTGWSDFVFKKEYNLPTLEQVEKHIIEKGHLENIPNEQEVLKNGINLGEMNAKLLQKMEEMMLYIIEVNKKVAEIQEENKSLVKKVETIEKRK
ncbi:hypothetical protein [Flavobacterium sp. C3NV]|uniref:hypothetical protein n=1 Tax=Flavobacterium sp. C3NV TaxID=3393358 RepID=UPI0039900988